MAGLDGCGKLDVTEMSLDNIVSIGDKVWVRAEVEEKIWIYQGRPCTVIKFDDACFARLCNDQDAIPGALLFGVQNMELLDCGNGAEPGPTASGSIENGYTRKAKSVRSSVTEGQNKEKLDEAKTAVDLRAVNALGFQGTAVIPSAAIIPMRSNIKTYGPYASSNFSSSYGGTQVEVNTDLAPWVFGSTAGMNSAGQSIVESTAIGLNKAETGGITIPGLPISNFTKLGTALGSGGATLSGMNFSYGSGGVSTSYEFRTYTPKFGGLSRHLVDRIKDISRNRTEQLRFLRNQQVLINKTSRKLQKFNNRFGRKGGGRNEGANKRNSLQRILVAEIYDWQKKGQRTVVGTDVLNDLGGETVYKFDKKAYVSWDYFFGPVSKKGDGGLPQYASFESDGHSASPILPHPPFSMSGSCEETSEHEQYNLTINRDYLDPLTNNFEKDDHHHDGKGRGHVTDFIGRKSEVPKQGLITNFYRLEDDNRYSDDYRFLAMRGPILLHSWGYDLDGKPVPNEADIENDTKSGKFKKENLKDAFLKDWLGKPASWPVAPMDLRFDRDRGLWVSPQPYKIVVSKIIKEVPCNGEGKGVIVPYGKKLFDQDGVEITPSESEESNECGIGLEDKEYEWVLVNISTSGSEEVWYCCSSEQENCNVCLSSKDPNSCGEGGAVSGPYNSLEECQAACQCEDNCEDGIEVITGLSLGSGGLIAQRKRIRVQCAVDIAPITIAVDECEPPPPPSPTEGSTPTPTPTPTSSITPTPTNTPTPTKTQTPTPSKTPTRTPTPTPSYSQQVTPTGNIDLVINIVDRLGKRHDIGELVYAYFDTSTEKYIVLDKHPEPVTPTIYGLYNSSNKSITVDYAAGIDSCDKIYKGTVIPVVDKLNLVKPGSNNSPAIAIKMEKLRPQP
jgi:hypothetical protein